MNSIVEKMAMARLMLVLRRFTEENATESDVIDELAKAHWAGPCPTEADLHEDHAELSEHPECSICSAELEMLREEQRERDAEALWEESREHRAEMRLAAWVGEFAP